MGILIRLGMLEERGPGLFRWDAEKRVIGEIVWLMSRNSTYGRYPIVSLRLFVEPPVLVGQYRIFYDCSQKAVGYVLWASVCSDISERIADDHDYKLTLSEWNEGEEIWITDFFVFDGFAMNAARKVVEMFPSRRISYVRRWAGGRENQVRHLTLRAPANSA